MPGRILLISYQSEKTWALFKGSAASKEGYEENQGSCYYHNGCCLIRRFNHLIPACSSGQEVYSTSTYSRSETLLKSRKENIYEFQEFWNSPYLEKFLLVIFVLYEGAVICISLFVHDHLETIQSRDYSKIMKYGHDNKRDTFSRPHLSINNCWIR